MYGFLQGAACNPNDSTAQETFHKAAEGVYMATYAIAGAALKKGKLKIVAKQAGPVPTQWTAAPHRPRGSSKNGATH